MVPTPHRRRLGRRRPGLRRPRDRRATGPARRRPGDRGRRRGDPVRRAAARHAPPAVPQARARRRGHRPQGAGRAPAPGSGLRAVHRPHQRRRARRRRLGVAGAGAGPRAIPGPLEPTATELDKLVVFVPAECAEADPRRPRRGRRRDDRRLRLGVVHDDRRGTVPAARRGAPRHRDGRRGRAGGRGPDRGGRPASARRGCSPRCWRPTPTRSRPTTSSSSPPRRTDRWLGPDRAARRADHACGSSPRGWPRRCPRPPTGCGSRAIPTSVVQTVALCGGAGDFLLDRARAAGADVYLTSDLRHHPASELREHGAPALVDVAHWAAEWTWLPVLAASAGRGPGRYGGGPGQHHEHRSVDLPGLRIHTRQEHPLKADPLAQLQLLDVQELDSRIDTLTHQLDTIPEAARMELAGRRTTARRTRSATFGSQVDDLTAEQKRADADVEQVKTRRQRDQGMSTRADHRPQGAGADARGARVAGPPDHLARGRGARGDGAAREGAGRPSTRAPPRSRR